MKTSAKKSALKKSSKQCEEKHTKKYLTLIVDGLLYFGLSFSSARFCFFKLSLARISSMNHSDLLDVFAVSLSFITQTFVYNSARVMSVPPERIFFYVRLFAAPLRIRNLLKLSEFFMW